MAEYTAVIKEDGCTEQKPIDNPEEWEEIAMEAVHLGPSLSTGYASSNEGHGIL